MLNYIHLENFKAFGSPTTIPLAPITLIFGENSAGKSSILQALSLLHQTAQSDDPDAALVFRSASGLVDLGSFHECLHDHDHRRTMRIGIGIEPLRETERGTSSVWRLWRTAGAGVHWSFRQKAPALDVKRYEIAMTDGRSAVPIATFRLTTSPTHESAFSQTLRERNHFRLRGDSVSREEIAALCGFLTGKRGSLEAHLRRLRLHFCPSSDRGGDPILLDALTAVERFIQLSRSKDSDATARELLVAHTGSIALHDRFKPTLSPFGTRDVDPRFDLLTTPLGPGKSSRFTRELLSSIWHQPLLRLRERLDATADYVLQALKRLDTIGPLRTPAERHYTFSGTRPKQVGHRGERMADLLRRDETVLRRTNAWMKRFEIGYQLRLRALSGRNSDVFEFRLVDQTRRPKVNVSFSDVGFGISQLLPILVQSIATEDRVITIEQPELHVHPRLQAEIGDLLVDCVEQNGHQFLVETHSEHLILRLRRLVREGKIDAKHISVIYVGRGREGSTVQQIGLKPDGTFDQEWPGGFFPERLRELL